MSGVSAKQLEQMQYLHRTTWKKKLMEIEGSELKKIEVSEALEGSQLKKIEGSFHQERPELDPEKFPDVDILERPDKWRNAEKIRKFGGTPKQRREQIRARHCQVSVCVNLERLGCVFCTSSVPAGWSLVWTTSRSHVTAPSPLLLRPIPRSASGAPERRPQRNRMSLPSYTIPDESMPQRSVNLESHKKRGLGRVVVFFLVEKGAAVSLSSRGRDQ